VIDETSNLAKSMAQLANGHDLRTVVEATGIMLINSLRQSNPKLVDAERELDDLVEQMKAAMRENHYTENGEVKVHRIIVPHLDFSQEFYPV
jgi:hypothetical protein